MLQLDISAALAKTITPMHGVSDTEIKALQKTLEGMVGDFLAEREKGDHAWAQLPYDKEIVSQTEAVAAKAREMKIEKIIWIGIGGSGLGPRVIKEVFETAETPELVVIDTIDPSVLSEELKFVNWKKTMLVVASKSGGTLEPMSAFFFFAEKCHSELKEKASEHIIAVTDPEEGILHDLAMEKGYTILPIAPGVGGRYSIVTPIGLLPVALLGGDLKAFITGMKEIDTACQHTSLDQNPAAQLALIQYILDTKHNYPTRVIMPYSTRLQSLGRWEQQLLAESLGKSEAYGPSPLAGIGTQDQHSMLQQWVQGRRFTWHVFITEQEKEQLPLPSIPIEKLSYLNGKSFGDVLDALYHGTSQSLTAVKRPHVTIELPRLDSAHLGQLFFLFMVEVILLGKLYRIDPYGQPGVEMGKKIAKERLGA